MMRLRVVVVMLLLTLTGGSGADDSEGGCHEDKGVLREQHRISMSEVVDEDEEEQVLVKIRVGGGLSSCWAVDSSRECEEKELPPPKLLYILVLWLY
ncbi:hypothetical protein BKA62DRAFT_689059 [Auriculariales sp. MPI-PUGE-AT-0066]|nr:hypothetical protein BKA62DRAFT_689059 [Auriculariales sp. MPI-PUGE-AT-0066]